MSKFSKGDKARVKWADEYDAKEGVKVGDIVTVNQSDSCCPWVILGNGRIYCLTQSQMEHYTEAPKEITLNGTTYILKEEPNPEHDWKFGDVAINKVGKVGIIVGVLYDKTLDFYYNEGRCNAKVSPTDLTFIRRADFSV